MKSKRIKTKLGDVITIPIGGSLKYSSEWAGFWEPNSSDEVYIAQLIAISATSSSNILLLIFEETFTYEKAILNSSISQLTPMYVLHMTGEEISLDSFKVINNCLIEETTPYLIYKYVADGWVNTISFWDIKPVEYSDFIPDTVPNNIILTGGLIQNELTKVNNGLTSEILHPFLVTDEKLLSNYFPESKNNPTWVLEYYRNNLR